MMLSGRKQSNNIQNHSFFDDQSPQKYLRSQTIESLNSKLALNINKIVELFKQRKAMLMKKAQIMLNQNHNKIDSIARAKFNQLRTQAKNLRDQTAISLIQNAERFNGSKNILQKIADINVNELDSIQSKRNKQYYDGMTKIQNELKAKMAKYKIQSAQIEKLADRERQFFRQIQTYQSELIQALTTKAPGHINIAQKKQDQIDKIKLLLKNNKTTKDKKKKQLQIELNSIVDLLQKNQSFVNKRKKQIEQMFGGYDSLQDFDQFYKNFQTVVQNKMEDKKQDQKAIHLVIKLANYYETQMQEIQKISQDEVLLFQNLSESFRKNIRLAMLQRAYLSNVQVDKSALGQLINKCRIYRNTLQKYEGQSFKSKKQLQKVSQFLNYFYPVLKAISSEDVRRQQLRKQLLKISSQQGELQKIQKKQRDYQYQLNNYFLQKQALERQQQQCAKKGNLNEYKLKSNMLQKIQKDIDNHKNQRSLSAYNQYQAKLNIQIQRLNQKYSDLIQDILTQQKQMTCSSFLNKLSKRLSIL